MLTMPSSKNRVNVNPSFTGIARSLLDGRKCTYSEEVSHGCGTKLWVFVQPEEFSAALRPVCRCGRAWPGGLPSRLQHELHYIGCGDCDRELPAALKQSGSPVRLQSAGPAIPAGVPKQEDRGQKRSLRSYALFRQAGRRSAGDRCTELFHRAAAPHLEARGGRHHQPGEGLAVLR